MARRRQRFRRNVRAKTRLVAGGDERRDSSNELAECGAARLDGEERPALQPRGELGLQIETYSERRMTEHVVDDSKLVDDTALAPGDLGRASRSRPPADPLTR